ncbi:hypothetical protein Tco_1023236 [Tanacetum coccineum]
MILQDTLQVNLAEHKSREEQEARENVELVNKHVASVEIEKMVEESENVIDDSPIPRNVDRLEPRSDKESPKVEITNVVIHVNVNEEEEEITDEVYKLKRREKGKIVEESRSTPSPTPIRFPRIHTDLELQGRYGYLFEHLKAKFLSRKSFDTLTDYLQEVMVESLPRMVDKHIKERVEKQVPEQERGRLQAGISSQIQQAIDNHIPSLVDESVPQTTCRTSVVRLRDQVDPHDDALPEGENSKKQQKTSEYEAYLTGESCGQTESHALDDDEIPMKKVSQDIIEEVSLIINEAELKKIADEIKEILASPHPRKTTPLVQSCQRDPEAPALSLINQDLLYLKKGNSGPEKIVLSLHKFPAIIFNDVDIKERTSKWVNKCVKKFNPYARYGVELWKNPHAKIFYIKRQKEPGKPKEVVYSNSKIIQVIKTY